MFFNMLRFLFYSIILIIKAFAFILISIFKLIRFSLTNKFLRVPVILLTIAITTPINIAILFTIYYFYLIHLYLYKNNTYYYFSSYILSSYKSLKIKVLICSNLKKLKGDKRILKDFILDTELKPMYFKHLVLTPNGVYNIIPCNYINNKVLADIYKDIKELMEFVPEFFSQEINFINIVTPIKNSSIELVSTYPFDIVSIDELTYFIQNNSCEKAPIDIDELVSFLKESKLWFIDTLALYIIRFLKVNRKILAFLLLTPIVYIIYILLLMFITDSLSDFTQIGLLKIKDVFNSF